MARDTLVNAKTELHGLLGNATTYVPVASLQSLSVAAVYPHEPKPGDGLQGCFATVEWHGTDPEHWRFVIRVYASTNVSAALASSTILAAASQIDTLLHTQTSGPGFGPSEWEGPRWNEELGAFIATTVVMCGRGDLSS